MPKYLYQACYSPEGTKGTSQRWWVQTSGGGGGADESVGRKSRGILLCVRRHLCLLSPNGAGKFAAVPSGRYPRCARLGFARRLFCPALGFTTGLSL
jgi:hypothetical protein